MSRFIPYRKFRGAVVPDCLMEFTGLTPTAKLVWAKLAQYAGENGECYPSFKTLAHDVGVSRRQVIRLVGELVANGFLEVERLPNATNRFYFLEHHILVTDCHQGSDILSPGGCHTCHQGGDTDVTHKRIIKRKTKNNMSTDIPNKTQEMVWEGELFSLEKNFRDELAHDYPGVDIIFQTKCAHDYAMEHRKRYKVVNGKMTGYRRYLRNWMHNCFTRTIPPVPHNSTISGEWSFR